MSKTEDIVKRKKSFWNNVYQDKMTDQTGWYQKIPETSLDLIRSANLSKSARIIDVGGGDSLFVDHLLNLGFQNITVLDISNEAIIRAKKRLGKEAKRVEWIVADVLDFDPDKRYDLWHDRACLHFLTEDDERWHYSHIAKKAVSQNGTLIIGGFSTSGPERCSGLPIKQSTSNELYQYFSDSFSHLECMETVHLTPSNTTQNYVFCRFKKRTN